MQRLLFPVLGFPIRSRKYDLGGRIRSREHNLVPVDLPLTAITTS